MIQKFVSNLSEKEKKIFYIAVAFVLLALLDRIFFGPAMDKLNSLDKEIADQQNEIKRDLRFLSYKEHILNENKMYSSFFQNSEQTEEEIIAAFLKKIEILASEAKINLIKVKPTEVRTSKGYIEYFANLECDGPLENVITFMHSIDSSADLLKIIKINMMPKRASATEVSSTMEIKKIIIDSSSLEEARRFILQPEEKRKKGFMEGAAFSQNEEKQSDDGSETVGGKGEAQTVQTQSAKDQDPNDLNTSQNKSGGGASDKSGKNTATWKASEGDTQSAPAYQGDFSQRYQIKGRLQGKDSNTKKKGEQVNPEKYNPIKPSVWERILGSQGQ